MEGKVKSMNSIIINGNQNSFCLPELLFHGTHDGALESIFKTGLDYSQGLQQSIASQGANYLTTNQCIAENIAASVAKKCGGSSIVIAVESRYLNPDFLRFDINMCGEHWSESIAYDSIIEPNWLKISDANPGRIYHKTMQLGEPTPGSRPLVFLMDWVRSHEFIDKLNITDTIETKRNHLKYWPAN